jgi:hypothetical protein
VVLLIYIENPDPLSNLGGLTYRCKDVLLLVRELADLQKLLLDLSPTAPSPWVNVFPILSLAPFR